MREALAQRIRNVLRRVSLDIMKFDAGTHPLARRQRLLEQHGVDLIFDVGANIGQYATEARGLGYRGWIISFEPLSTALPPLRARAAHDPLWKVVAAALGPAAGQATLNVAGNSLSSSLLPMLEQHVRSAPTSGYVGVEQVSVRTLASALDEYGALGKRPFVKIDAQGYEQAILQSGGAALARVVGAQLEMSLTPLYEGEVLLADMVSYMSGLGLSLMSIEPGYADPVTGRLLQADGLFFREG